MSFCKRFSTKLLIHYIKNHTYIYMYMYRSTFHHIHSIHVQVLDIYDYQIQATLNKMSSTLLLSLPSNGSTTTEKFMVDCKEHSKRKGKFLQRCSQQVERSVQELLQLLKDNALLSIPSEADSHDMAQTKKGTCNNYMSYRISGIFHGTLFCFFF